MYDLILGVGSNCDCSHTLRHASLQHLSFPYDWIIPQDEADILQDVRNALGARYPGTVFDVLLIQPDPEIPIGERKVEHPAEGVTRLSLDYRESKTTIVYAIQEMFSVREYRTPEEIAAVREFNPGGSITDARRGDPTGWNAIFSEFAPGRILTKSHVFKFE